MGYFDNMDNNYRDFVGHLTSLRKKLGLQAEESRSRNMMTPFADTSASAGALPPPAMPNIAANQFQEGLQTEENIGASPMIEILRKGASPIGNMSAIPNTSTSQPSSFADRLSTGLKDPGNMALLRMGLSMMSNPPRRVPYSPFEIFGKAGTEGLDTFTTMTAQQDAQKRQNMMDELNVALKRSEIGVHNAQAKNLTEKPTIPMVDVPGYGKLPANEAWRYLPKGENSQIGKVSPDKFTPESIVAFQKSGNYADLKPINSTGTVDNPNPSLTGEAALANYTPRVQTLAKGLANYTIAPPSSFALRDPKSEWNAAIQAAKDLDPSFDMKEYQVRYQLRKSFTSGADSKNVNSINTLVGHLDSLKKSADALANTSFQPWNKLANIAATTTGDPRVTKFNMDLGAVESELASVFKGTGATDQEIKTWRSRINDAQSPEQLEAVIKEAVDLMGSRLQALQNKYQQGMGRPMDFNLLSPKSRKTLEKLVGPESVEALEPNRQAATTAGNVTKVRMKDGTVKTFDSNGNEIKQ